MNYIFLDFEYNKVTEKHINVVCASFLVDNKITRFWLNEVDNTSKIVTFVNQYKDSVFVSYNVEAESQAFISLGLSPVSYKWIDLYLEYKHLVNHNHKIQYGEQLLNGKIVTTSPPRNKWTSTEEQRKYDNNSKPNTGLAAACFKLLGIIIDTDRKNKMRSIIIESNYDKIEKNKEEILEYCDSDVKYLPLLLKAIEKEYSILPYQPTTKEIISRAEYSARTAVMVSLGYPVDVEAVNNFSNSVKDILWEVQNEINELFPDILPFTKKRDRTFSWSQIRTKKWVTSQGFSNWMKTDKGDVSLSLEAFSKFFDFRHNFPKDSFGAQMVRYLKLRQSLNGFSPNASNKFVNYLGSDGRVRPYFNIYGSQSSRSQPKATGFLFLKSAWMRALCVPPKGRVIGAIDYKSQEFLLAAVSSKDNNMIDAYMSGDPYLYFAKQAGAVPPSGTKETHGEARNLFKATTLGLSYDMSKVGLAKKLTNDLGRFVSEEEAQRLIDKFYSLYSTYKKWKWKIGRTYIKNKCLRLADGWCMWGDNSNMRSVGNFPIQGLGSVIMRKAVSLAQDSGLDVIQTLHDALYIEYNLGEEHSMEILASCMQEAFRYYMPNYFKNLKIGMDANIWSTELEEGIAQIGDLKVKQQNIYIDARCIEEYNKFKKYFINQEFNL